jgi:hypothetical protein
MSIQTPLNAEQPTVSISLPPIIESHEVMSIVDNLRVVGVLEDDTWESAKTYALKIAGQQQTYSEVKFTSAVLSVPLSGQQVLLIEVIYKFNEVLILHAKVA